MVSTALCPAVHILGSQNVYGRAEGIADHYWLWAVFLMLGTGPLINLELFIQLKLLKDGFILVIFHISR